MTPEEIAKPFNYFLNPEWQKRLRESITKAVAEETERNINSVAELYNPQLGPLWDEAISDAIAAIRAAREGE